MGRGAASLLVDSAGNPVEVELDEVDGKYRIGTVGKVSISNPTPPVATTPIQYESTPLDISFSNDTVFIIPDDKMLTIQSVFAGVEGDPTVKGSKVEVIYTPDGGTTEKIIERVYVITGDSRDVYPDTNSARDGTILDGVATDNGRIILRRTHFGGGSREFDVVVRGYLKDKPA